ncbi:MAG: histidinol-phosphatase [Epulopiscium sp.]|nr:histidinol-phosphatase [Candidatus Epulonipiscium sp.]
MGYITKEQKTYRYETHLHTKEGSACASATGAEMVRAHISAGYAGMIVTDHFFNGNTSIPRNLPWETRVALFCQGYENAVEEAKGTGFHVFFGWEYGYDATEFLTYGLTKDFLLAHPDMLSWSIEKYFNTVHKWGGFISHAHPFREADYIRKIRLFPNQVDAVEVINTSHTNPKFDIKALDYAKKHSLLMISGSDTHHTDKLCGGGMEFNHEIHSIEEFIKAIKNSKDYILLKGKE